MASVGSISQQFVPGPGVLIVGRDCAWNDRVGLNELLATGKPVFMPNTGKVFNAAGPIYGFLPNGILAGPPGSPALTSYIPAQVQNMPPNQPVIQANFQGGPCVLMGNQAGLGNPIAGTYPAISSVMDSTAGTRYGIRTFNGNQRVSFYSDGFQLGGTQGKTDYFSGSAYTIAIAFYACNAAGGVSNALAAGGFQIAGASSDLNAAIGAERGPWNLQVEPNGSAYQFQLTYGLLDGSFNVVRWPYPTTATGVIRLYLMFDCNRTQWTTGNFVVYMDTGTGPTQPTYNVFATGTQGVRINNKKIFFRPFSIGRFTAPYTDGSGSNNSTLNLTGAGTAAFTTDDFVLCGIHVESGLTYKDNGSGTLVTQAGAAITDSFAFYSTRSTTCGLLPLTSSGSTLPNEVQTAFLGGSGYAFLFNYLAAGTGAHSGPITLKNLTVVNSWNFSTYGDAVAMMTTLGCYLQNLALFGEVCAFRGWTNGSNNYYMCADTLQMSGDIGACGTNTDFVFKSVQMTFNRVGFYYASSGVKIQDLRVPGTSNSLATNVIWMDTDDSGNNPSSLELDGYNNDNEGLSDPTDCIFRCNNCTVVALKNVTSTPTFLSPQVPISTPLLTLGPQSSGAGSGAAPGTARLDFSIGAGPTAFSSLVRVEDSKWFLDVRNPSKTIGVHGLIHDVSAGCGGTVEQIDVGPLPPRTGAAYAGMHISKCRPLPGQFAEWRCLSSGVYGSANPPQWLGQYPNVAPGSNQCAAYAISCIGVNDPQTYSSFLTDNVVNGIMEMLFTATAWAPPGVPTLALTCTVQSRTGNGWKFGEMSSPEIQQITITNASSWTTGTVTLTFNGQTTTALAPNATLGAITSALEALTNIGTGNVKVTNGGGGNYFQANGYITITFEGSMGNASQPLVTVTNLTGVPSNVSFTSTQVETGGGYARVAPTFAVASTGSSANTNALAFPTSTAAWNTGYPIVSWNLATGTLPATGTPFMFGMLASPPTINTTGIPGPSWAIGGFELIHAPSNNGSFTTYAANQIINALLQATAFTAPTTWYVGLSSTPISLAGTGLTEASGGGYARVAVTNASTSWTMDQWYQGLSASLSFLAGTAFNTNAITFPTPTAAWSSGVSLPYWFLADAATGGNIWATGTIPVAPVVSGTSSAAPSFAAGAFVVQLI